MAVSICIGSIINTLNKLRPFFQQFPLDRIEVDLFPDGPPEFYFAFNINISDADCEHYLHQLQDAKLSIQLASKKSESLTQTLFDKSRELMNLYYPLGQNWSLCTLTFAPLKDLYQEVKDEGQLPPECETSDEIGFRLAVEFPLFDSNNEVEVETFYGTISMLCDDFSLKNGTLH